MIRLARILIIVILCTAGCAHPQPVALRVLSYNIHHAEGTDKTLDLERIARIICESGADLVALQEVDRNVKRSASVDQPARLAELTGLTPIFEKNIDLQGGQYGNAILSRLPVESYRHHLLPRRGQNEQRGLLQARIRTPAGPLVFMATHFDHQADDAERMDSVVTIRRLVDENSDLPVILAGDLNTYPDSRVIAELSSFLLDTCPPDSPVAMTFPAGRPRHRIDYILFNRDPRLRSIGYRIPDEPVASDHRPVLATFLVQHDAKSPKRKRGMHSAEWPTSSGGEFTISLDKSAAPERESPTIPSTRPELAPPSQGGDAGGSRPPQARAKQTNSAPRITINNVAPAEGPHFPPGLQRIDYTSSAGNLKDWALVLPSEKPTWIVMIHGHGTTGDQLFTRPDIRDAWLPVFKTNYGILTVNLRGNAWMSPDAAADLHALLAEIRAKHNPRRFVSISASMGGASNLIYAVLHPEDVAGVIALCPAADLASYYQWCNDHKDAAVLDEISGAIDAAYTGAPGQRPELYRQHSAVGRANRLTMPVYVVHSSTDAIIPVTQSRALAKAIGTRDTFHYHEIENGNHEAPLRHVQEALNWILRKIEP